MSHVDYQSWVEFAISMFTDHGIPFPSATDKPEILECACGTGSFAARLAVFGYNVEAFDRSPAMIEIAETKVSTMVNRPRFFVADFISFETMVRKDVVLCLYDSINYLEYSSLVIEYFARVRKNLKPGGIFIFDICTEANSRLYFSDRVEKGEGDGYKYKREMYYHPDSNIQENIFSIVFDSNPAVIILERHQQRIYSAREMRKMVKKAGFEVYEETDEFSRHSPHRTSQRIHFVCRNPG